MTMHIYMTHPSPPIPEGDDRAGAAADDAYIYDSPAAAETAPIAITHHAVWRGREVPVVAPAALGVGDARFDHAVVLRPLRGDECFAIGAVGVPQIAEISDQSAPAPLPADADAPPQNRLGYVAAGNRSAIVPDLKALARLAHAG